jgi:S-formylglutathione hydrolase
MAMLELISEHACFGGVQRYYRHQSTAIGLPMRFGVFLPAQASSARAPALFCLAGLTCNEETFATKAGAQRKAAELGLMLVTPDTSPRDANVPGETDSWDLGMAAGFYVDATEAPWRTHYRMYSYLLELRELVIAELPAAGDRVGIMGHSMGGHGALVLALRNQDLFKSVSALAPISAPTLCPWGEKAFSAYLGPRSAAWETYDASALMSALSRPFPRGILVDQGLADKFLPDQLFPAAFEAACAAADQPLTLRRHECYDHGYYFIATVIDDHLKFHHEALISQGVTP